MKFPAQMSLGERRKKKKKKSGAEGEKKVLEQHSAGRVEAFFFFNVFTQFLNFDLPIAETD